MGKKIFIWIVIISVVASVIAPLLIEVYNLVFPSVVVDTSSQTPIITVSTGSVFNTGRVMSGSTLSGNNI